MPWATLHSNQVSLVLSEQEQLFRIGENKLTRDDISPRRECYDRRYPPNLLIGCKT